MGAGTVASLADWLVVDEGGTDVADESAFAMTDGPLVVA